ncbi:hypothetical protein ACRFG8_26735, partial [Klebsiella pneumoniae]
MTNIAASSDYRGQACEWAAARRRAERAKTAEMERTLEKADRFGSTEVQNRTEVETRTNKHRFLIQDERARKIRRLEQK